MAKNQGIIVSAEGFAAYFEEVVETAFNERGFNTFPSARNYLVQLLQFYVPSANFFDEVDENGRFRRSTLAEAFLKAMNEDTQARHEQLKKLADRALYISGFFGDSLQRKVIDIDYYCEMGVTAYGYLADSSREDLSAKVYREFASRFLGFTEVLSSISTQARMQDEANILRLYETYAKTGSDLARERLLERGLIAVPLADLKKPTKQ